jgi:hypothetical protein
MPPTAAAAAASACSVFYETRRGMAQCVDIVVLFMSKNQSI